MTIEAAKTFTQDNWHRGTGVRLIPARIIYHLLAGGERYTWRGRPEDFLAMRRYKLNWLEAPLDELPGFEAALSSLDSMRQQTDAWLLECGDDGLLHGSPVWPWCGSSLLAQALYLLRHTQYHVSDLNAELRRAGLPTAKWQ